MRCRFLNKMTNEEVEAYLKYNDLIFVPVGRVEAHGSFPNDASQTIAEALAVEFAEEADGLIAANLPYFFAGETGKEKGTIEISVEASVRYLKELAYSFLNQGFRHQVYLTDQGAIYVMMGNLVIDFFDESKVPISYMTLPHIIQKAKENDASIDVTVSQTMEIDPYYEDLLTYGAYKILGRQKELVIDESAVLRSQKNTTLDRDSDVDIIYQYGGGFGAVGYYKDRDQYSEYGAFPNIAARDAACALGEELFKKITKALDIKKYIAHLHTLDQYTQTEIKQRFSANLPKNRFSEWI